MIMVGSKSNTQVRNQLRIVTHEAHQALHVHPLLARLQAPDLTYQELIATAAVSCQAIGLVDAERKRRGIWPDLSLSDHLNALRRDLGVHHQHAHCEEVPTFKNQAELLGALYVIHGSAFGGAMLYKEVKAVFPQVPKSFFLPKNTAAWQYLCLLLASLPDTDLHDCEAGALGLFDFYGKLADFHLETLNSQFSLA